MEWFATRVQESLDGFMIQLNKNAFGLAPTSQQVLFGPLPPGGSAEASVGLAVSAAQVAPGLQPDLLQVHPCPPPKHTHTYTVQH